MHHTTGRRCIIAYEGPCTQTTFINSLNQSWPTGKDYRSKGDDHLRYLKCLILNTWPLIAGEVSVSDEEFNYLSGVTSSVQDQFTALGDRITAVEESITDTLTQNLYAPAGTKMIVHQAAAPAGWVNSADVNDRLLRVVSSGAGDVGGSWTISGLTAANHSLTIPQMPNHNHGGGNHRHTYTYLTKVALSKPGGVGVSFQGVSGLTSGWTGYSGTIIQSQGSGQGHSHGVSSNGAWRPSYADVLIIEKS